MFTIEAIKPGPKPKKPDGTPDRRRRVTPPNKPKHPGLKPHKHEPGDQVGLTIWSISKKLFSVTEKSHLIQYYT